MWIFFHIKSYFNKNNFFYNCEKSKLETAFLTLDINEGYDPEFNNVARCII